ncbi:RalA-binding protein 1 [Thelohanellus kitauei]|uniref:RalA-binding protein 1 n=1 Tax=Thelohanellus kitauei TaxID=669202 RepID=A0A0C2ML17_THEKT|nr:RalA-binding protein 1 [Thelohanellus kitauei]
MNFIRRLTRSTSSSQEKPQEPDLPLNCNIFGSSLKFSVLLTFREDNISSPRLIRDCIMYINEHGLDYPGIYRESGSYSKIEQLKNAYNEGDREEGIVKILRYYLLCLPHCSYCTLGWVIRHLSLVYNKSKVNSMSLNNLIIIFSPCLNIQPLILSKLIVFADYLFVEDELGPKLDKNQIFELRYVEVMIDSLVWYLRNEMSDTVEAKKAFANLFSKGSVYKMNPYLNNLSGEIENSILSLRSQVKHYCSLNLLIDSSESFRASCNQCQMDDCP